MLQIVAKKDRFSSLSQMFCQSLAKMFHDSQNTHPLEDVRYAITTAQYTVS